MMGGEADFDKALALDPGLVKAAVSNGEPLASFIDAADSKYSFRRLHLDTYKDRATD